MQKTPGDIIILHKCTKHHDPMLYCSWDMASDRLDVIVVFHFALFFPFYPSNSTKNQTVPEIKYVMNLFLILCYFCLFFAPLTHPPPPTAQKPKIKKKQTPGDICLCKGGTNCLK